MRRTDIPGLVAGLALTLLVCIPYAASLIHQAAHGIHEA